MNTLDTLDTKIIRILQVDGRATNANIARSLKVSEGTIRRRLKRLVGEKFIQILAQPDPVKMGYEAEAMIGMQVDPDKISQVANSLSELHEINWVAITTGSYDIFAWTTLKSSEALGVFLRTKVGVVDGVRRTETFVKLDKMQGDEFII